MVSFDNADDNKRFAEMHSADFPILSDPDRTIGKAYGVESPRGFYMRHTYYIAKDGTIAKIDRNVNADTAGRDTVKAIEELKLADKK
jgi:thioredoxin-dependent peroxiredoxin